MKRALNFLILVLLASCITPKWGVETYYIIKDVDKTANGTNVGQLIEKELNLQGYASKKPVTSNEKTISRLTETQMSKYRDNDKAIGFVITGIENMAELGKVQKVIVRISRDQKVPVDLYQGQLYFQSIYGSGEASISLKGKSTPGSVVDLDDGSSVIRNAKVNADGTWTATVYKNERLEKRNGIVYGRITKHKTILFFKMSILSNSSENINKDELPADSPLR